MSGPTQSGAALSIHPGAQLIRPGLGGAVARRHRALEVREALLDLADDVGRSGRAADADAGDLGGVDGLDVGVLQQAHDVGGATTPHRDAFLPGELQHVGGIEATERPDGGAPRHHRRHRHRHPRHVEQRVRRQPGRRRRAGARGGRARATGRRVPAIATPRAAMKHCSIRYEITDRCESTAAFGRPVVPLVKMRMNGSSSRDRHLGQRGRRVVEQLGEVVLGDQHRYAGVADEAFPPLLVHHQQLRLGEVERVAHLGAGPPAVHRHQHRVERGRRPRTSSAIRGSSRRTPPLGHRGRCRSGRGAQWRARPPGGSAGRR